MRDVPRIVPPLPSIHLTLSLSSGMVSSPMRPSQPFRMPMTSSPTSFDRPTTPRITAFRPGQSPPAVNTPMTPTFPPRWHYSALLARRAGATSKCVAGRHGIARLGLAECGPPLVAGRAPQCAHTHGSCLHECNSKIGTNWLTDSLISTCTPSFRCSTVLRESPIS